MQNYETVFTARLMILAMMGCFMWYFDKKNGFSNYMTRSSFGFYILHYTVVVAFVFMLKTYTTY